MSLSPGFGRFPGGGHGNRLIEHWAENKENILRPVCGDTPGAPVLFPKWSFPELLNLPEGKGGGVVMKKHPEKVSVMQIQDPYELMDADTPETLELLKGLLS